MLCDRAMLLYRGRTLALGDPSDVRQPLQRSGARTAAGVRRSESAARPGAARGRTVRTRGGAARLQFPPRRPPGRGCAGGVAEPGREAGPRVLLGREHAGASGSSVPRAAPAAGGGHHDPHAHRHGSVRNEYGARTGGARAGRPRRFDRGDVRVRMPSDSAGIHVDGCRNRTTARATTGSTTCWRSRWWTRGAPPAWPISKPACGPASCRPAPRLLRSGVG